MQRMGYLGLMILLDERQEVLMLVTNSLKNDLNSRNQYIVGLALCAFGNICSAEMARDLTPELERLLQSSNSYIRKKAALCCTRCDSASPMNSIKKHPRGLPECQDWALETLGYLPQGFRCSVQASSARRVIRKVPDSIEAFQDAGAKLLLDRHHGVLLTGVTLMLDICAAEPAAVEAYRKHVPALCKILRSLLMSGFAPEHDVSGITDPFLQIKVRADSANVFCRRAGFVSTFGSYRWNSRRFGQLQGVLWLRQCLTSVPRYLQAGLVR